MDYPLPFLSITLDRGPLDYRRPATKCLRALKANLPLWMRTTDGRDRMPQIIVTADRCDQQGDDAVMLRERINASDLESEHFASHLVERIGWAVGDANELEREATPTDPGPRRAS